jgi:hypothetical protein
MSLTAPMAARHAIADRLDRQKNRTRGVLFSLSDDARRRSIVVVVVMMVVMASGPEHDPRDDPAIGVMVVVVMMVTTHHDKLRHLDIPRRRRSGFVDRLQQRRGVRDRLEQVGEGIGPQDVGRRRTWNGRGLGGTECSERRHRSQKSCDLLFHSSLQ